MNCFARSLLLLMLFGTLHAGKNQPAIKDIGTLETRLTQKKSAADKAARRRRIIKLALAITIPVLTAVLVGGGYAAWRRGKKSKSPQFLAGVKIPHKGEYKSSGSLSDLPLRRMFYVYGENATKAAELRVTLEFLSRSTEGCRYLQELRAGYFLDGAGRRVDMGSPVNDAIITKNIEALRVYIGFKIEGAAEPTYYLNLEVRNASGGGHFTLGLTPLGVCVKSHITTDADVAMLQLLLENGARPYEGTEEKTEFNFWRSVNNDNYVPESMRARVKTLLAAYGINEPVSS